MPLANELPEYEAQTINCHRSRGELEDGNWNGVDVLKFTPNGRDNYYYTYTAQKTKIVLHYTIGFLGGDLSALTRDDFHVSVPFIVARSGEIIQLYDPRYWSYHLTPGAVGGNKFNSRGSVPIEISNIGPLEVSGNWLWNYYGDKYCRVEDDQFFVNLGHTYRGYSHFATFTTAQYKATDRLVRAISNAFDIPHSFLPAPKRFELFDSSEEARSYHGICSHVNFQPPAVKNDIGPAFDWGAIGSHEDDPLVS